MGFMNPKIDKYLLDGCMRCKYGATPKCKVNDWRQELTTLRLIMLETKLKEELKWNVPCYTYQKKNVLIISALKESATVSFFKGSLLTDSHKLLEKPGKNSQVARYLKFTSVQEILDIEHIVKEYIQEAVELEKAAFKKNPEPMPEELEQKLREDPEYKAAFEALTPGRQRSYILHISGAKQSQTRVSRVEKYRDKVFKGKGFNEY